MSGDDIAYLKARETEERDAAAQSACIVKGVHLEAAELYAERASLLEHPDPQADANTADLTRDRLPG